MYWKTIVSYLASARSLSTYLATQDMTNEVEHTGAAEVRVLLLAEIDRTSAVLAAARYRNLRFGLTG